MYVLPSNCGRSTFSRFGSVNSVFCFSLVSLFALLLQLCWFSISYFLETYLPKHSISTLMFLIVFVLPGFIAFL